jgi:hypothetical protein
LRVCALVLGIPSDEKIMSLDGATSPAGAAYVFPPALVRLVREHVTESGCLLEVADEELVQLFTTIFFAGLDTHEGEHNPISVVFLGRSHVEYVLSERSAMDVPPVYQWKILRFTSPRPFAGRELVKLAVAGADRRIYSAVGVLNDGRLAITGLGREGVHVGPDPFVRITAPRPGCLSIRGGRDLAIEYERGIVVTVGDDGAFAGGPVRRTLETIARSAGMDGDTVSRYLDAVVVLVREMVAHGRGGILIISQDEHPVVAESAPYRLVLDFSLGALLRLAWRVREKTQREPRDFEADSATAGTSEHVAFGALLRNAFQTEAERVIEELGRLTAIDGAVLLNRSLALVAFGMILPVRQQIEVVEAADPGAEGDVHHIDLGSRGTRHRAAATYAAEHPGSVVFISSEDGEVSCLFCDHQETPVRRWRLMTSPRVRN